MATCMDYPIIQSDRLTIFTCNDLINEWNVRFYIINHWKSMTQGMDNSTILFISGVHGMENGGLSFGPNEDIQCCWVPEWLVEDKENRNITLAFIEIPKFVNALEDEILLAEPKMVIFIVSYSQFLNFRFLLERTGIRTFQDLHILSKGQILALNEVQKDFFKVLADERNIEKDVWITGPVGSGKTMLGLETIKMKIAHFKKKYGLRPIEDRNKIRVLIIVYDMSPNALILRQIEEETKTMQNDCVLRISHSYYLFKTKQLEDTIASNFHDTNYVHTIIMQDEVTSWANTRRSSNENTDYIFSVRYADIDPEASTKGSIKVKDGSIECNLDQRQRSSQEILDLLDYCKMHVGESPMKHFVSKPSFTSGNVPLWIQMEHICSQCFIGFTKFFDENFPDFQDVLLVAPFKSIHHETFLEYCREKKWEYYFYSDNGLKGAEVSVVILLGIKDFNFEWFSRAKHQLIIITVHQSPLETLFSQMLKGHHNDETCKKYCAQYRQDFKESMQCNFNGNEELIKNLLKRIPANTDGSLA